MKYDDTILQPPGPIVEVIVRPPDHPEPTRAIAGKIDTGADITLIPLSLVLDLELKPRYRLRMRGYDGAEAERLGYTTLIWKLRATDLKQCK